MAVDERYITRPSKNSMKAFSADAVVHPAQITWKNHPTLLPGTSHHGKHPRKLSVLPGCHPRQRHRRSQIQRIQPSRIQHAPRLLPTGRPLSPHPQTPHQRLKTIQTRLPHPWHQNQPPSAAHPGSVSSLRSLPRPHVRHLRQHRTLL